MEMEDVYRHFRNKEVTHMEEKCFFELFKTALAEICYGRASDQEISDGIESAIANFRNGPYNACAIENLRTFGDLCGSFFYFSTISAAVARTKTMAALRNCEEFRTCLHLPLVKMVSIGGGTGCDLVGLFSAISEGSDFRSLDVRIIDNVSWYEPFFGELVKLLREGDFGNASQFVKSKEITASFICGDVTDDTSTQYQDAVKNSQIIWMKGFLSILKSDAMRLKATKNIVASMTPGSLLVVIDSPSYDNFEEFSDPLERIFSPSVGNRYTLEGIPEYKFKFCKSSNQEIAIFRRI